MPTPPIETVLETCLYVDDLAAAHSFYTEVLGLRCVEFDAERHLFLDLEPGNLLLFLATSSERGGDVRGQEIPPHGARGPGHIAFMMSAEGLELWQATLRAQHIDIESVVDWPQGGRSIYFRDPAGNSLELAERRIWNVVEEEPAE
ncbi:MAG: VOC family protein [Planctomycetota bacterium]|jgi:catechol 2,3-dioxygenase-like lactoylglutathione lyase family enzyme|nr:VOC family protein [Planctomycetota bacterium]